MKKFTLLLSSVFCYGVMNAQTVLFDNGPLVNQPGAGTGGADVSTLHDGLVNYGFGHALSAGFRVADDFTVPAGQMWNIDSIVFFAYQTNSGNTSSIVGVNCAVYDASPANAGAIILGDETTNIMTDTYWSGIYRTSSTTFSSIARPIMRDIAVPTSTWSLLAGTYWLSWQSDGNASFSGPWVPPVTFSSVTLTGDGLQSTAGIWSTIIDTAQAGTTDDVTQGLPFIIYGQSTPTGISEIKGNSDFGISNLYPVPVKDHVNFTLTTKQHSDVTITLKDAQGKEVQSQQLKSTAGANNVTIDLSKQSAGIYFITASSKTATVVSKFVKE
jgi:hypothetical protein